MNVDLGWGNGCRGTESNGGMGKIGELKKGGEIQWKKWSD